jgi:hypothetical protein
VVISCYFQRKKTYKTRFQMALLARRDQDPGWGPTWGPWGPGIPKPWHRLRIPGIPGTQATWLRWEQRAWHGDEAVTWLGDRTDQTSNTMDSYRNIYIIIYIWEYLWENMGRSWIFWLVVDLPLWKIWKSMGRIIPYIMENKKCLKPPTRLRYTQCFFKTQVGKNE